MEAMDQAHPSTLLTEREEFKTYKLEVMDTKAYKPAFVFDGCNPLRYRVLMHQEMLYLLLKDQLLIIGETIRILGCGKWELRLIILVMLVFTYLQILKLLLYSLVIVLLIVPPLFLMVQLLAVASSLYLQAIVTLLVRLAVWESRATIGVARLMEQSVVPELYPLATVIVLPSTERTVFR